MDNQIPQTLKTGLKTSSGGVNVFVGSTGDHLYLVASTVVCMMAGMWGAP